MQHSTLPAGVWVCCAVFGAACADSTSTAGDLNPGNGAGPDGGATPTDTPAPSQGPVETPPPSMRLDGGVFSDPSADAELAAAAVGGWQRCRERLELRADASFTLELDSNACEATGEWRVEGGLLFFESGEHNCELELGGGAKALYVQDRALVLVDPREDDSPEVWITDRVPRRRWFITGNYGPDAIVQRRVHRAEVIGEPGDGLYSACYWTPPDNEGDGLLSNGGRIERWAIDGRDFQGRTSCGGTCACAAVLRGTVNADNSIEGEFFAANCDDAWDGIFEAIPE